MIHLKSLLTVAIVLGLSACGKSPTNDDSSAATAPASSGQSSAENSAKDPSEIMQDGLANVAGNIAANAAGELRTIEGPIFDDFEFGIAHGITMHNPMKIVNTTVDTYDLELFEQDPNLAFSGLIERLQGAGFTEMEHEKDESREKWKFRRNAEGKGNAAVFVSFSLRPFRAGASKTYPNATTKATLEVSDSRAK